MADLYCGDNVGDQARDGPRLRAPASGYLLGMEILVAILIIALIAAVVFAVMQRRPAGGRGLGHSRTSPLSRRDRGTARRDPMAAAVVEHAEATGPHEVAAAEERLRAQARQVAAPLNAEAHRREHQRAADQIGRPLDPVDPATGARTDGYEDPATDPRYDDRSRGV